MNKPIDIVKYRGKKIKVYADDYGQSYYFIYNGKSYSCDTYNFDYIGEIISVLDDDLDEEFYVLPDKEHRPSAKVFKRYGVWCCDYNGYKSLRLSYGDILPPDKRPTRDDLIARAHEVMKMVDGAGVKDE